MAIRDPHDGVVTWLLEQDVAVRYQATRDLLGRDEPALQRRIATEGAGAKVLAARKTDGHWGRGFYQPKWTSSHYTLLELRNLGLPRDNRAARETVELILATCTAGDGGLDPRKDRRVSDACVNGMALNYASWFGAREAELGSLVDCILERQVADGGFNCRNRPDRPVAHSSMHTTVSVLEGIDVYLGSGHTHRAEDVRGAANAAVEFLLRHDLFRSERTGEVIRPDFLRLHHPARWHFDILRGLDCLARLGVPHDPRLDAALDALAARRRPDGRWSAAAPWPGARHLPPEPTRAPSPWVTLMARRVMLRYRPESVEGR